MMTDQELQAWSYANWMKVHPMTRNDCLNELRGWIGKAAIGKWKVELKETGTFENDNIFFHSLGGGMQIRNKLRAALSDDELPGVIGPDGGYPKGQVIKNWDDFYLGALQELAETTEEVNGTQFG